MKNNWYTYIIRCKDDSLYTGTTTDVSRRVDQHNDGTGSKYVRSKRPATLVCCTGPMSRSEACKLESHIKSLHKTEKIDALFSYVIKGT